MTRISVVGSFYALSVIFDSVVHIGDTRYIQAKTNVFALQREIANFEGNEFPLEQFPLFRRPIPKLSPVENVRMVKLDTVPAISVGVVKINGLSTSAIAQVGSNVCMELESRIKHIRQFAGRREGAGAPFPGPAVPLSGGAHGR